MIEKETMLTVFGVILLAMSYGLSSSYILKQDASQLVGSALPFVMNMAVMLYISYGLFSVSKLSDRVKVFIILGFVLLSYIELAIMYDKPSSSYGVPTAWIVMTISTFVRLYFIISLHCDLPKSFFVMAAKSIVEPGKVVSAVSEIKVEPSCDKAFQTFDSALNKTQLTAEEKSIERNKFRAAWGKPPKEVVLTGGKRR